MKKSILKITGAQQLSKASQLKINGGDTFTSSGCPAVGCCFSPSLIDSNNNVCIIIGTSGQQCRGRIRPNPFSGRDECCF
ncbi:hypothetical protein [Aquimarina algicola]|uniref:Uncharacterized protein n=1 Tax=Aquimarina algicola TaxID=2589995 RepID=A0A504J3V8_9FLAO|nr:hypothetical protein [Aquimarina algicola]TPN81380.1 hypothetical protein FHK87_25685 [Aquimarina algicola]